MNKKILAVALAILFIATAFTACKSKLDMTEINGKEYPLATDKDGNTIVNEENKVAVLVTERDGEVIKYENGEDQTYWVELPKKHIERNGYSLILKDDWIYDDRIDCFVKKDHEKDIIVGLSEYENNYSSLDEYMVETEKSSKQYIESIKQAYPKTEITITDGVITSKNLPSKIVETKVKDNEGKVFYYGYLANFEYNGVIVTVEYVSQNYTYKEAVDVLELFNNAFVFEEPQATPKK